MRLENADIIRAICPALRALEDPAEIRLAACLATARRLLALGEERLGSGDALAAASLFRGAAAYGSNEALHWIGTALVRHALSEADAPLERSLGYLWAGLDWLRFAASTGLSGAAEAEANAHARLPDWLLDHWRTLPQAQTVKVH